MVEDEILTGMLADLERTIEDAPRIIAEEAMPVMQFVAGRIRANVPYLTGNLAEHIFINEARSKTMVEYTLTAETPYALAVHERAPGEQENDPDGSTPEGGRGRKYLTRVIEAHGDTIRKIEERAITQLLRRR